MKDIDLTMHDKIWKIKKDPKDPKELCKSAYDTLTQMNENSTFGKNRNTATPKSKREMV